MAVLVSLQGLTKTYGRGRHRIPAVLGVNLDLETGLTTGLVGESGSGKSTVARLILGLETPDSGQVLIGGRDLATLVPRERQDLRRRMQIVFQDPDGALDPRDSVGSSLEEGLRNLRWSRADRRRRVREVVDMVGIPADRLNDHPHRFSGGQKQRLVIARALTVGPEFLVLDEPVSALDVSVQAQVINLLKDLKAELGLTYLFVSHDLHLVAYLSDTIAVMKEGVVVETGQVGTIVNTPADPYTQELFADQPRFQQEPEPPFPL